MASKASGLRRLVLGRNLAGGRLGQQRLGLASPILFLDLAAELQRLVDVGDVVVGERRDLVEAGDVEPQQLRLELWRDALDELEVVSLALRLLEALEAGGEALGARVGALGDAGRLAAAAAEVIELGAADLAAADDVDRVDRIGE